MLKLRHFVYSVPALSVHGAHRGEEGVRNGLESADGARSVEGIVSAGKQREGARGGRGARAEGSRIPARKEQRR